MKTKDKPTLVVLTGAGISAESGIPTFRASDGLWENHRIEDVATPEGWRKNPQLVLDFYNERRAKAANAQPNAAHHALVQLEQQYHVLVITQNVDDLHERAGSANVLHLHGKLKEVRSTKYPNLIYDIGAKPINMGDKCEKGCQLRPNIVWFNEAVPMMEKAIEQAECADIFAVIGTSLAVYPAAGLLHYLPPNIPKYLIDPKPNTETIALNSITQLTVIAETATKGCAKLLEIIGQI